MCARSGVGAARSRRLVGRLRSVVPGIGRWEQALVNGDAAHRDDSIHRSTTRSGEMHEGRREVRRCIDDGCADLAAIQTWSQFFHRPAPSVRANKPGSGAHAEFGYSTNSVVLPGSAMLQPLRPHRVPERGGGSGGQAKVRCALPRCRRSTGWSGSGATPCSGRCRARSDARRSCRGSRRRGGRRRSARRPS
ncbi:MAG: hypothetical protein QOI44_204 [Actinomycetota bacterium]|nr:hypothetical protein [Actinomycetota bacterium]